MLDLAISKAMSQAKIPGAIVGIWSPQGQFIRAFGVADKKTGAKMTTEEFMRIGSETKTFTTTAVLQLVDEGKVGLDDKIGQHLKGVPNGNQITIRELGEMRSGLPSYSGSQEWGLKWVKDTQAGWTPQQLLSYGYKMPQLFKPGTKFDYSNSNTVLLGLLVEKLSGMSLSAFMKKRIIDPLALTKTSLPLNAAFPRPHPQGYTNQTLDGKEAIATDWNPSWGWAAGAMISSVDDLAIWAKAVATGTLLEPATQAERLKFLPLPGYKPGSGYGFGLFEIGGWIGHNGSLPGYQSLTIYHPTAKTTVVILLNTDIPISLDGGKTLDNPSSIVGKAVTTVLTPDQVFEVPGVKVPDQDEQPAG